MYGKLLFAAVLIAFVSVQLVYTLQCYECGNPSECRSPAIRTCDERAGNTTTRHLARIYRDVSNKTSSNFECLHLNGTQNNVNTVEIRGCLFTHIDACNLIPMQEHSNLAKTNCTRCAGNLCNGKSPAGTFSSSFFTIVGSAVMMLVVKVYSS